MVETFMNELVVKYKVATCHCNVAMSYNCIEFCQLYIYIYIYIYIISDLQLTTSKRAISIKYKLIMNII